MRNEIIPTFKNKTVPWTDCGDRHAVVLMSGGVDSSAAAIILLRRGYSVAGLTMKISESKDCPACDSAASVCKSLSIPHFSADVSNEFKSFVLDSFNTAYYSGMTPNPCADCNEHIKFGALWDAAESAWGKHFYVATGHYAEIIKINGKSYLSRGANKKKDQSYFLSGISRDKIGRIIFPLGKFISKDDVRALVRDEGLSVSEQPESMDICFAHKNIGGYRTFLCDAAQRGPIKDTNGKILGTHKGVTGYTLGQRTGLGIASSCPLYVVEIRPCENSIIVAPRDLAFSEVVAAEKINALAPEYLTESAELFGKIRSQGDPVPCSVISIDKNSLSVKFNDPVFAPAPGQRLVLYTAEGIIVAGGIIKN
jgi:tRNA-specific 2-thiouridylase